MKLKRRFLNCDFKDIKDFPYINASLNTPDFNKILFWGNTNRQRIYIVNPVAEGRINYCYVWMNHMNPELCSEVEKTVFDCIGKLKMSIDKVTLTIEVESDQQISQLANALFLLRQSNAKFQQTENKEDYIIYEERKHGSCIYTNNARSVCCAIPQKDRCKQCDSTNVEFVVDHQAKINYLKCNDCHAKLEYEDHRTLAEVQDLYSPINCPDKDAYYKPKCSGCGSRKTEWGRAAMIDSSKDHTYIHCYNCQKYEVIQYER